MIGLSMAAHRKITPIRVIFRGFTSQLSNSMFNLHLSSLWSSCILVFQRQRQWINRCRPVISPPNRFRLKQRKRDREREIVFVFVVFIRFLYVFACGNYTFKRETRRKCLNMNLCECVVCISRTLFQFDSLARSKTRPSNRNRVKKQLKFFMVSCVSLLALELLQSLTSQNNWKRELRKNVCINFLKKW